MFEDGRASTPDCVSRAMLMMQSWLLLLSLFTSPTRAIQLPSASTPGAGAQQKWGKTLSMRSSKAHEFVRPHEAEGSTLHV